MNNWEKHINEPGEKRKIVTSPQDPEGIVDQILNSLEDSRKLDYNIYLDKSKEELIAIIEHRDFEIQEIVSHLDRRQEIIEQKDLERFLASRTFKELTSKIKNVVDNSEPGVEKTPLFYWSTSLSGELGEVCELFKKLYRDGLKKTVAKIIRNKAAKGIIITCEDNEEALLKLFNKTVAEELADMFIYLELTARAIGEDLEESITRKLKVVEDRVLKNYYGKDEK